MFISRYELEDYLNDRDVEVMIDDERNLTNAQNRAVEETKTYIQHRYDQALVFPTILDFDSTTSYTEGQYIRYAEEVEWDTDDTYAVNDRVYLNDKVYKSLTGSNTGNNPETDAVNWEYTVDNQTYYTAAQDGSGNYPEDSAYWTLGDPRNALVVDYVLTLTCYKLYRRVQPNNIPDWIMEERENTIDGLKRVGDGRNTLILPVALDADGEEEGHNITYGSQECRDVNY